VRFNEKALMRNQNFDVLEMGNKQPPSFASSKMTNLFLGLLVSIFCFGPVNSAEAYPLYAQQGYENPREATGRIVCANCHLAQKPVDIEVPQAVLPDTVFEAVVKIPYDQQIQQVLGTGKKDLLM